MSVGLLLASLLLLSPAHAQDGDAEPGEDGYVMNDVGGALELPRGWEMQKWSDWDFKAKSSDGVLMRLHLTPFQVAPSDAAAEAWTGLYEERLEEAGGAEFEVAEAKPGRVTLAGGEVDAVVTEIDFVFEKQGVPGIFLAAAVPAEGQVVHIEVISAARNERRARAAFDELLVGFTLDEGPAETTREVASEAAGFAFTLPEGWRAPLDKEWKAVRGVTSKIGEKELDPDKCAVGIQPHAQGQPDVLYACELYKHVGIVDEHSFEGVEAELRATFFAGAQTPVEAAEQVQVGDRLGFLYEPHSAGTPVALAIAPYDKGLVTLWGLGSGIDQEGLDQAVRAVLPTVQYTHEGGGQPIVALDQRVSYYLKYRPTSPFVLGPAVLLVALVGGGIAASRKKKSAYDLDDDEL